MKRKQIINLERAGDKLFTNLQRKLIQAFMALIILLQQVPLGYILPASAAEEQTNPLENVNVTVHNQANDYVNGSARVEFGVDLNQLSDEKLTFFLFYGDNFYSTYDSFDSKSTVPEILEHNYRKPGTYKPLLVAYSSGLKHKEFRFLDPIIVEKKDITDVMPPPKEIELKQNSFKNNFRDGVAEVGFEFAAEQFTDHEYTVLVFWGDNFYSTYDSFTSKLSEFPPMTHKYKKPGTYRPFLAAYAEGFREKVFKYGEPIVVEKINSDGLFAAISLLSREDFSNLNEVHVEFSGYRSFDPATGYGDALTYHWDFGDGTKLVSQPGDDIAQHTYTEPGSYQAKLFVENADGETSDTVSLEIQIENSSICPIKTWTDYGGCGTDCDSAEPGLQGQENVCGSSRSVPCFAKACQLNRFNIKSQYLEAGEYLIMDYENGNDLDGYTYSYTVKGPNDFEKLKIFKKSTFLIPEPGDYEVTFEMFKDSHKISKYKETLTFAPANLPPLAIANADISYGEVPLLVSFDASDSYDPEGAELLYHWDFGDGATANGAVVLHEYQQPSHYRPVLTVTDDRSKVGTKYLNTIQVEEKNFPPEADFSLEFKDCSLSNKNGQSLVRLNLQDDDSYHCSFSYDAFLSKDPNNNISDYEFNVYKSGLNLFSSSEPVSGFDLEENGDYLLKLIATDEKGLNGTYSQIIQVLEPLPIADVTLLSQEVDLDAGTSWVDFSAEATKLYEDLPLTYRWDFGDGQNGSLALEKHFYAEPGLYSPKLEICRHCDDANTNNDIKNYYSLETIVVDFAKPLVGSLSFTDPWLLSNGNTTISSVTIGLPDQESWQWNYQAYKVAADGSLYLEEETQSVDLSTENILDAPQTFTEPGQYSLVHAIDGKQILSETLTVTPNQIPVPKISLQHVPGQSFVSVNAEDSYDPKSFEIVSYEWDFGDGASASGITAEHSYSRDNVYYIKLRVVDDKGLSSVAYSRAIVVGDVNGTFLPDAPDYEEPPDEEFGEEDLVDPAERLLLKKSLDELDAAPEPVDQIYYSLEDKEYSGAELKIDELDIGSDNQGFACSKAYAKDIDIDSVTVLEPSEVAFYEERGARIVQINGNNFCKRAIQALVSTDGGRNYETRPTVYLSSSQSKVKLQPKDFNDGDIKIRLRHKSKYVNKDNQGKTYSDTFDVDLKSYNPATKTLDLRFNTDATVDLSNPTNFIISSGSKPHFFKPSLGPVFYESAGTLKSKNLKVQTLPGRSAKLAVELNGANKFGDLKMKVNGNQVKNFNPGNKKYWQVVSNPFEIQSGDLNIELDIGNPSNKGVVVEKIQVAVSADPPPINNLVYTPFKAGQKIRATVNLNTSPYTRVYAALINRPSTKGTQKGKHRILQVLTKETETTTNNLSFDFEPRKYKEGVYYIFFYLTNGTKSDKNFAEDLEEKVIDRYKAKARNDKAAFLTASELEDLYEQAKDINHVVLFADEREVNFDIDSYTDGNSSLMDLNKGETIFAQSNNQILKLRLLSSSAQDLAEDWEYSMTLMDGKNLENSSRSIELPVDSVEKRQISGRSYLDLGFRVKPEHQGSWNLLINASKFNKEALSTYGGAANTAIQIKDDKAPIARINTLNPNKLIQKVSKSQREKVNFDAWISYDPNKVSFPKINDGLGAFNWQTVYKPLGSPDSEAFKQVESPENNRTGTYAIGPRSRPGIYKALMTVWDFFGNSDSADSDTVQVIEPGQKLVASLTVKNDHKIFAPNYDQGAKDVKFDARVKVISSKSNKAKFVDYKFVFGDGTVHEGRVNSNNVPLNKYIDLPELRNQTHVYPQGEFVPKLEVSAEFENGEKENWTVSAGTVTVADLPSAIAFTPIIANRTALGLINPGFEADLRVLGKQVINSEIDSFGWDFGDGESWTYNGNTATQDFEKSKFTNHKHTYNETGIFELKFWVQKRGDPEPLVFALKPLEVVNAPEPEIDRIYINGQLNQPVIDDESALIVRALVNHQVGLERVDLRIRSINTGEAVFIKTYVENIDHEFSKSLPDLYLEPGRYSLDLRFTDEYQRSFQFTKSFKVISTPNDRKAIDFSDIDYFKNKKVYLADNTHLLPIRVQDYVKELEVYINGKLDKTFTNLKPAWQEEILADEFQYQEELDFVESSNILEKDFYEDRDFPVDLFEGVNSVQIKATLPSGKRIELPAYQIEVDSATALIEIDTPVNESIYPDGKVTLAGSFYEENTKQLLYRINGLKYKKLDFEIDSSEPEFGQFMADLDLDEELNSSGYNRVEVMLVDKAGNKHFAHADFIVSNKLDTNTKSGNLISHRLHRSSLKQNFTNTCFYLNDPVHIKPEIEFASGASGFNSAFINIPQGLEFDFNFLVTVCDDSYYGTNATKVDMYMNNPHISFVSESGVGSAMKSISSWFREPSKGPLSGVKPVYQSGNYYKYHLGEDLDGGGSGVVRTYASWTGLNSSFNDRYHIGTFDSISSNAWERGTYYIRPNAIQDETTSGADQTFTRFRGQSTIVISEGYGDRVDIADFISDPEVRFPGHILNQALVNVRIQSITPIDSLLPDVQFYQSRGPGFAKHPLAAEIVGETEYKELGGLHQFNAQYKLTGFDRLSRDKNAIQVVYVDDGLDGYRSFKKRKKFRVEDLPNSWAFVNIKEKISDEKISAEDEGEVSLEPKVFQITVHHLSELANGDTQSANFPFDSEILPNLVLSKFDNGGNLQWVFNGLDMFENGSKIWINKVVTPSSFDSKYPGFLKTVYETSGPNGGTLFKTIGEFQARIDFSKRIEELELAGGNIHNKPKPFYKDVYRLLPQLVEIDSIDLDTDTLVLIPDYEEFQLVSDPFTIFAGFDYANGLSADFESISLHEVVVRKENGKRSKEKFSFGLKLDASDKKQAFVELGVDVNYRAIVSHQGSGYSLEIPAWESFLDLKKDVLLRKHEATTVFGQVFSADQGDTLQAEYPKTLSVPLSILTKSNDGVDVLLTGKHDFENFSVRFLDDPKFVALKNKDLSSSIKFKIEGQGDKKRLIMNAKMSNIVGSKFDPLELVLYPYDELGNLLGNGSYSFTKDTLGHNISPIKSRSWKLPGKGRSVARASINLARNASENFLDILDDIDHVDVQLKRDWDYLMEVFHGTDYSETEVYNQFYNEPYENNDRYVRNVSFDRRLVNRCYIVKDEHRLSSKSLNLESTEDLRNKITIDFESASKNAAVILVQNLHGNSEHKFESSSLVNQHYDSRNISGYPHVDPVRHRVSSNKGSFNFEDFIAPADSPDAYSVLFQVAKANARLNVLSGGSSNTAADCLITVGKPESIRFRVLEEGFVNLVEQSTIETITTTPAAAIESLSLSLEAYDNFNQLLLKRELSPNHVDYSMVVNLFEEAASMHPDAKEYKIIVQGNVNDEQVVEERSFKFVLGAEPVVSFAIYGDANVDPENALPRSIVYAQPGTEAFVSAVVSLRGFDGSPQDLRFNIKNLIDDKNITKPISSNCYRDLNDDTVCEVTTNLDFYTVDDIKLYDLQISYENSDRQLVTLSAHQDFLVINNPELVVDAPDVLRFNGDEASLDLGAKVVNGFPGYEMSVKIGGDQQAFPGCPDGFCDIVFTRKDELELNQIFVTSKEYSNNLSNLSTNVPGYSLRGSGYPLIDAIEFVFKHRVPITITTKAAFKGSISMLGPGGIVLSFEPSYLQAIGKVGTISSSIQVEPVGGIYFDTAIRKNLDPEFGYEEIAYLTKTGPNEIEIWASEAGEYQVVIKDLMGTELFNDLVDVKQGPYYHLFNIGSIITLIDRGLFLINPERKYKNDYESYKAKIAIPPPSYASANSIGLAVIEIHDIDHQSRAISSIVRFQDNFSSCVHSRLRDLVAANEPSWRKAATKVAKYINSWFINALYEGQKLNAKLPIVEDTGEVGFDSYSLRYSNSFGSIADDLSRLLPKTESHTNASIGYCISLAQRIAQVRKDQSLQLYRVFESNISDQSNSVDDYKVLWLGAKNAESLMRKYYSLTGSGKQYSLFNSTDNFVDLAAFTLLEYDDASVQKIFKNKSTVIYERTMDSPQWDSVQGWSKRLDKYHVEVQNEQVGKIFPYDPPPTLEQLESHYGNH